MAMSLTSMHGWIFFFPEVPPTCAASRRVSQEHYRPSRRDSTATSVASSDIWGG